MSIARVPFDDPDATALRLEMEAESIARYGEAQPEAIAMYEAAGYSRLAAPGDHPRSVCFERALS